MSSAGVSLATTQPRSSRPSTSGRTPCGSRAAYSVCSSMKTRQNAPRRRGSTSSAVASSVWSGSPASSAVTSAVSVVLPRASSPRRWLPYRSATRSTSSAVLVRLPLCPSATVPAAVGPSVGCAFSHVEPPVVEYRACPMAMCPCRAFSAVSSKTWETRPMSL